MDLRGIALRGAEASRQGGRVKPRAYSCDTYSQAVDSFEASTNAVTASPSDEIAEIRVPSQMASSIRYYYETCHCLLSGNLLRMMQSPTQLSGSISKQMASPFVTVVIEQDTLQGSSK